MVLVSVIFGTGSSTLIVLIVHSVQLSARLVLVVQQMMTVPNEKQHTIYNHPRLLQRHAGALDQRVILGMIIPKNELHVSRIDLIALMQLSIHVIAVRIALLLFLEVNEAVLQDYT